MRKHTGNIGIKMVVLMIVALAGAIVVGGAVLTVISDAKTINIGCTRFFIQLQELAQVTMCE